MNDKQQQLAQWIMNVCALLLGASAAVTGELGVAIFGFCFGYAVGLFHAAKNGWRPMREDPE